MSSQAKFKNGYRWIFVALLTGGSLLFAIGYHLTGKHRVQRVLRSLQIQGVQSRHAKQLPDNGSAPSETRPLVPLTLSRDLPATFTALDRFQETTPGQVGSTWIRFNNHTNGCPDCAVEPGWQQLVAQLHELRPAIRALQDELRASHTRVIQSEADSLPPRQAVLAVRAAGWLAASIHEHLANNQPHAAADSILDLLAFSSLMTKSPDWRSHQLRLQLDGLCVRTSWQLLQVPNLPTATLDALHIAFESLRATPKLPATIQFAATQLGERLEDLRANQDSMTWTPPMQSGYEMPLFPLDPGPAAALSRIVWNRVWINHDVAFCLESLQQLGNLVDALNSERDWPRLRSRVTDWDKKVARTLRDGGSRFRLSQLLLPLGETLVSSALENDAWIDLCEAAIALHRFHSKSGTWPTTLDQARQVDAKTSAATQPHSLTQIVHYEIKNGIPRLTASITELSPASTSKGPRSAGTTLVWPSANP